MSTNNPENSATTKFRLGYDFHFATQFFRSWKNADLIPVQTREEFISPFHEYSFKDAFEPTMIGYKVIPQMSGMTLDRLCLSGT